MDCSNNISAGWGCAKEPHPQLELEPIISRCRYVLKNLFLKIIPEHNHTLKCPVSNSNNSNSFPTFRSQKLLFIISRFANLWTNGQLGERRIERRRCANIPSRVRIRVRIRKCAVEAFGVFSAFFSSSTIRPPPKVGRIGTCNDTPYVCSMLFEHHFQHQSYTIT